MGGIVATLVKIIWVSNMWSQAAENHKKCGPGCNCSICVDASITNTTGDAHSRQVAMDNVEMDELRYSEHFALQYSVLDANTACFQMQRLLHVYDSMHATTHILQPVLSNFSHNDSTKTTRLIFAYFVAF